MSDKVLVIRKMDATIHIVELSNKASLMAHSNKLKPADKWKFEEMERTEAAKLPHIDPNFVSPAQAIKQLDILTKDNQDKDDEITKLREQLAQLTKGGGAGTGGGGGSATAPKKVYALNVAKTVELINKAKDAAAVDALIADDDRKGVLDAADKQKATFK